MAPVGDVVVVGAGVMGCSIAYHLRGRGIGVTVLDRAEPASPPAASWASAGGVRRQGRDPREAPLAIRAIDRWAGLEEELGADLRYRRGGNLKVAEDEREAAVLATFVERQRAMGFEEARLLDAAELRALVPAAAPHLVAGAFLPGDGQADPPRTTRAFAAAARRRGARLRTGVRVAGLDVSGGRVAGVRTDAGSLAADVVVVAAGAWSGPLLADAGVRAPIRPAGLQMVLSAPGEAGLLGPVVSGVGRRLSLKQLDGGAFLMGGGWPADLDRAARGYTLRAGAVEANRAEAAALLPAVGGLAVERAWAGAEAVSLDGVPYLGAVPGVEALLVACGFSGHGFALAPAVGEGIAALIAGAPAPVLAPLDAARMAHADARAVAGFIEGRGEAPIGAG